MQGAGLPAQTALHSTSTSHRGPSLVLLVPSTGATLLDAISHSAKLWSSSPGSTRGARHAHGAPDKAKQPLHSHCVKSSCATEKAYGHREMLTKSQSSQMQPGASSTRDWPKLGAVLKHVFLAQSYSWHWCPQCPSKAESRARPQRNGTTAL